MTNNKICKEVDIIETLDLTVIILMTRDMINIEAEVLVRRVWKCR